MKKSPPSVEIDPTNNIFYETLRVLLLLAIMGDSMGIGFFLITIVPLFFFIIFGFYGWISGISDPSINNLLVSMVVFPYIVAGLIYVITLIRILDNSEGIRYAESQKKALREKKRKDEELFYKVQAMNQEKLDN